MFYLYQNVTYITTSNTSSITQLKKKFIYNKQIHNIHDQKKTSSPQTTYHVTTQETTLNKWSYKYLKLVCSEAKCETKTKEILENVLNKRKRHVCNNNYFTNKINLEKIYIYYTHT